MSEILSIAIFSLSGKVVTVANVVLALAIIIAGWIVSRVSGRAIDRAAGRLDAGHQRLGVVRRLLRYVIGLVVVLSALSALGIDLATLFTAGALFAVGIGFAMQDIAQNFVAGVILLVERNVKPGDVIDVDGKFIQVREMGIRSTIAWTRDQEEIIIPNSILAQSVVKNFTLSNSTYRIRAQVGVAYESDVREVRSILMKVGEAIEFRTKTREPMVLLTGFGANSIDFELSVWVENPWESRPLQSSVYEAIWAALRENHVTIAFPQLDLHLDPAVLRALSGRPSQG